jgi:tetratricopeptide (TPR) repeat protein
MSDPARTDVTPAADALAGRQRDARVEQLLLTGLDHYFAGRYDQAIHIWTRVLFLDRGHARARAYIDRARSALAERQRESEELLHRGTAAFDGGEVSDARRLLTAAVERGASPEVALAYLGRLDRLEATADVPDVVPDTRGTTSGDSAQAPRTFPRRAVWLAGAGLVVVTSIAWFAGALLDPGGVSTAKNAPDVAAVEPVPVPNATDTMLARARALYATGRAQDAIRLLGTIGPADANRPDADRLLAEIQRTLLTAADPPLAGARAER